MATKRRSLVVTALFVATTATPAVLAADAATVAVTATVTSKHSCRFNTANAALNFGNLDPLNPSSTTINTTLNFRCNGNKNNPAVFIITQNYGLHKTAGNHNRMNITNTAEYLPYTLELNPATATTPVNTNQTLTINGTVLPADIQNAYTGSYTDTVTLTINP